MGVPRELPGGSWGPSGVRRESVGGGGGGGAIYCAMPRTEKCPSGVC